MELSGLQRNLLVFVRIGWDRVLCLTSTNFFIKSYPSLFKTPCIWRWLTWSCWKWYTCANIIHQSSEFVDCWYTPPRCKKNECKMWLTWVSIGTGTTSSSSSVFPSAVSLESSFRSFFNLFGDVRNVTRTDTNLSFKIKWFYLKPS